MTPRAASWRAPAAALLVLCLVYVAGTSAVLFRPEGAGVSFWWPAAGLAVALVAAAPAAWTPALTLGVLVFSGAANVSGGFPWDVSLLHGAANAAEALVAGRLLKDAHGRLRELRTLDDVLRLLVAAVAGAAVVAVLVATGQVLLGFGPFHPTAVNVFSSHAAATMVIVPVAMAWRGRPAAAGHAEYVAQTALLASVVGLTFGLGSPYAVSFVAMPLLVWAALRLDPRTVTLELLAVCTYSVVMTAQGRGPFGGAGTLVSPAPELAAPLVQSYILATTLVALPLTVVITQRSRMLSMLAEREALFRRNFTESLTGMLLLSRRGDRLEIIDANEPALALLDDGSTPVIGRYLDRVLTQPAEVRGVTQTMLGGDLDGWRGELGLAHRPGSHIDVAISQLTAGREATFAAQLLDVTPLREALARTQTAERLTNATLDTTACIILVSDMAGTVVRVNRATTTLTGFPEDQILGRPVWESIVPPYRESIVREMFARPDGSGIPGRREANVQTITGDTLRVVWNNDLVRDEDGTPRYAVMTGIDVTAERTHAGLTANLFQAGITTAIIGIDSRGLITMANPGAEALLGRAPEELRGRPFVDLLDPEQLADRTGSVDQEPWPALTATLQGRRESAARDWTWVAAGGARRTVEMTISDSGSQFAPQAGYLVVGRDVTEQRHSQLMLMDALESQRVAADRQHRLDSAKNEFVSTVSHELRTPVTSIVGYTELLADGSPVDPHPAQVPLLESIARNGERLIALCNDLLTLAELGSEGGSPDRGEVDLVELVRAAEDLVRPLLRGRDLVVGFDVPEGQVTVHGDAIQLERVLLNLLSNAVKFTPDGGRVTTALRVADGEARLSVTDTGIGIPEAEQTALFQKFFRASTAQEAAIQGTGLGLSIVAGVVAAHDGRIEVASAAGEGTTVTVRLPLVDG